MKLVISLEMKPRSTLTSEYGRGLSEKNPVSKLWRVCLGLDSLSNPGMFLVDIVNSIPPHYLTEG